MYAYIFSAIDWKPIKKHGFKSKVSLSVPVLSYKYSMDELKWFNFWFLIHAVAASRLIFPLNCSKSSSKTANSFFCSNKEIILQASLLNCKETGTFSGNFLQLTALSYSYIYSHFNFFFFRSFFLGHYFLAFTRPTAVATATTVVAATHPCTTYIPLKKFFPRLLSLFLSISATLAKIYFKMKFSQFFHSPLYHPMLSQSLLILSVICTAIFWKREQRSAYFLFNHRNSPTSNANTA